MRERPAMRVLRGNLFEGASPPARGETFEELARVRQVREVMVERIASSGDAAPTEYVQEQDEWVALLQGTAELEVDGERVTLDAGDWLLLPARTPHVVVSTSGDALWLAVHMFPGASEA